MNITLKPKTTDEAFDLDKMLSPPEPNGWIQWKGTDVCMDIHCKCGELTHVDGEFCYLVKCPHCSTVYHCSGFIRLIEIDYNEKDFGHEPLCEDLNPAEM